MALIRNATPTDLPQILAINTHYILNTSLTFAQNPPLADTYAAKFTDITSRGLPYLVAVDETAKRPDDGNDLVLGYAYLAPFRGHMLSYAATVELSLFVHPEHQSRALGSRLLGEVLGRVEEGQGVVHRSFEITGSSSPSSDSGDGGRKVHAGENGEGVRVKNVLAVMAVNPEGLDGGDKLRRWYIQRGFVERGRMEKIGFKRGCWLDTIYLQYTVGS